ncbi:hypothetical protein D3C80_1404030 [compost metagenome]
MDRQVRDSATGLWSANLHAPTISDEALDHVGREREGCTYPQILAVVRPLDSLLIVERSHRVRGSPIGKTPQCARCHPARIPGIVSLPETVPLNILSPIHVTTQILDRGNFLHGVLSEKFRTNRV